MYGTDETSVWRIDANGRFSYVLPPTRNSPMGLQSFFIDARGSIYSANRYDHRKPVVILLRRDPNGTIGRASETRFTSIDGITALQDGTLVVVDGATLRTIPPGWQAGPLTTAKFGEDLLGLSSVRGTKLHVADHAGRRVLRVDAMSGAHDTVYRSGLLWAPSGVETDDAMYVLEHLRPPLSLLGDLQIGPYLRVVRNGETIALIWGRETLKAAMIAAAIAAAIVWLKRKRNVK